MQPNRSHFHWIIFITFCVLTGIFLCNKISLTYTSKVEAAGPTLLQPSDFTYLGYYDVHTDGLDSPFNGGLALRYVNGDLRLLMDHYTWSKLEEFSLAGKSYGDNIGQITNSWDLSGLDMRSFAGFYWDESKQKLMFDSAVDYTVTNYPAQVTSLTLNSDGTISNKKEVNLGSLPAKRVYGGIQPVPSWFQSQYGVGPYVVGWGGYTSLVAQGGGASLGPTMYSIADPTTYADGTTMPYSQIKTISDHGTGSSPDWYLSGTPSTYDRGERVTSYLNYFEGGNVAGVCGDPRSNGQTGTAPTLPPCTRAQGGQWQFPAPDGYGRWNWGDSYYNTGVWIDTPTKIGFVAIGSFDGGPSWYCNSTLCYSSRQFELHIFDPATLGKAAQGQIQPWQVQPASMTDITSQLAGNFCTGGGNGPQCNVGGAAFDSTTNKLYMMRCGLDTYFCRLFVYAVNTGSSGTPPPTPPSTPAPTVAISASPTTITSGSSSNLTWSSTNATSCTASNGWSGTKSTSGTQSMSPTLSTTYTLSCTGAGGSASQSATVTVTAPPPSSPPAPSDTTPPAISNISANSITTSGATISFSTNESSTAVVQYGLTTLYGASVNLSANTTFSTSFNSLTADTVYNYRIVATDTSNNVTTSSNQTFATLALPVTPPSSSGGGGGGGGGSTTYIPPVITTKPPTASAPPVTTPPTPTTLPTDCAGHMYSPSTGKYCGNLPPATSNTIPAAPTTSTPAKGTTIAGGYNFGTTTLRLGSRGEGARELQRYLNNKLKANLVLDGVIGAKTIAIIKVWQAGYGLVPDGLVGPKTKAMMNLIQ